MRNVEPSPPSPKTHRPSRPDWVTSGQFPEPSHPENHALLSGSHGDIAARPNNADVTMGTLPPYSTANRRMAAPLPIGFQNRDAQMNSVPTEPPPTYDQTFSPKDTNTPTIAAAGNSLDTSVNSPEGGLILISRTVTIHDRGNCPDDDNDDDKNAVSSCIKGVIMLIVAILIIIVKVLARYNRER